MPYPISWADEERDLTAWLGNELQNEAFEELYKTRTKVNALKDEAILRDFDRLQASDHFYYMCTKLFSDGAIHSYFTPYDTPYEAFINYMNVLSDFILRVEQATEKLQLKAEKTKESTKKATRVKTAEKPVKPVTRKTVGEKTVTEKSTTKTAVKKKK